MVYLKNVNVQVLSSEATVPNRDKCRSGEGWLVFKWLPLMYTIKYTGCPRKNVPDFGRVFLMLNYTDITQNTYIQS